MELSTKSLILRCVTQLDIDEIARMWKYPDKITIEDAYDALNYMQRNHCQNGSREIYHLCLGIFKKEDPSKLIGWCGLDGKISLGKTVLFYVIAEEFRCQGFATQCVTELLRYAFEDMDYDIIYGSCAKDNMSSYRVMEKAGMRQNVIHENGGFEFYMNRTIYLQQRCM